MKWYIWLQEEIDKAIKQKKLNKFIKYYELFTRAFMEEYTDFSHIKELFITAKKLGYLKEEIAKEDLDQFLDFEDYGTFICWDEMLNAALNQYIGNKNT